MKELPKPDEPAVSGGYLDPGAEPIIETPLPIVDYPPCPDPCADPDLDPRWTDPL